MGGIFNINYAIFCYVQTLRSLKVQAGRPTKYDEKKHVQLARLCARAGLTDVEIAKELEIATSTLYKWKSQYETFAEALKENKKIVDDRVKASLLNRALGYEYSEEVSTKNGIVKIVKVMHPDPTSAIFWLKNRQAHDWRDKKDIDLGDDLNITINIKGAE